MESNIMLNAALSYAARGWYVFPLAPGDKKPLGSLAPHGLLDASVDKEVIQRWWSQVPAANVGIATGQSGLIVVDIDSKNGAPGWDSWYALVEKLGPGIGDTVTVETPTGGCHSYYKVNGNPLTNTAGKLGDGLDTRATGGYVVAPPSIHPNGKAYLWAGGFAPGEIVMQTLPASLEKLLLTPRVQTPPGEARGTTIPIGKRNDTLTSMAGTMRRRGMSQEAIEAALLVENDACADPLPPNEVLAVAKSISRYAPAPDEEHATDLGNARRLLAMHGKDMHFCNRFGGWFTWAGTRWLLDEEGQVERYAKDVSTILFAEANLLPDGDGKKEAWKRALHAEASSAKKNMLDQAWSESGIPVPPNAFDADPWLLNCLNGTIDLRTGDLHEHDREDLITKVAPVFYDKNATLPLWTRFLETVTNGDQALIRFLQLCAGYSLTGSTSEERMFFVYGVAATGKSTFMEALKNTMGDYAKTAAFDAFLSQSRSGSPRDDIAELAGARLVASTEVDKGKKLADSLIKQITGGDKVSARFLFKPLFEFTPSFKLWLVANDAPHATDTDTGLWRRVLRVPFEHEIPEKDRDPNVKTTLTNVSLAGPAILAWAVAGCLAWQQSGLVIPAAVKKSTDAYREENDPLKEWYSELCFFSPNVQATRAAMWESYQSWAKENGEHSTITNKELADRLRSKGCKDFKSMGVRSWKGVSLSSNEQEPF